MTGFAGVRRGDMVAVTASRDDKNEEGVGGAGAGGGLSD